MRIYPVPKDHTQDYAKVPISLFDLMFYDWMKEASVRRSKNICLDEILSKGSGRWYPGLFRHMCGIHSMSWSGHAIDTTFLLKQAWVIDQDILLMDGRKHHSWGRSCSYHLLVGIIKVTPQGPLCVFRRKATLTQRCPRSWESWMLLCYYRWCYDHQTLNMWNYFRYDSWSTRTSPRVHADV